MSQTTANEALTTLWNISAPLHVMVIENSTAEAEPELRELRRVGFDCQPVIICARA